MKTVGVLAAIALGAILLLGNVAAQEIAVYDNGTKTWTVYSQNIGKVEIWDWIKAITPKAFFGTLIFGDGSPLPAATLTGADNTVAAWIYVLPKPLVPGKSFYVGKTKGTSVIAGVVLRNGSLIWNSQVDNAAMGAPGTAGYGGQFVLPSGFFQRLPRKK
jgi:hypothetical protein